MKQVKLSDESHAILTKVVEAIGGTRQDAANNVIAYGDSVGYKSFLSKAVLTAAKKK